MCQYKKYDSANDEFYCCVGGERCSPEHCFLEDSERCCEGDEVKL